MKPEYYIFICAVESFIFLLLNKWMATNKNLYRALLVGVFVFIAGFIVSFSAELIFIFFRLPFMCLLLIALFHLIMQVFTKTPFFVTIRGLPYPEEYSTEFSGFNEFLCGLFTLIYLLAVNIISIRTII